MDLRITILSEVIQTEKDKHGMISWNLKKKKIDTNELIYKTETDSQTQETNYGYWRGKGLGKGKVD